MSRQWTTGLGQRHKRQQHRAQRRSPLRLGWIPLSTPWLLGLVSAIGLGILWVTTSLALPSPAAAPPAAIMASASEARSLYATGHFQEALMLLQQQLERDRAQGDRLAQALTLSNLSLCYQALGQWQQAQQASNEGLRLIESDRTPAAQQAQAQGLMIRGQLQFSQGQVEPALQDWEQATALFQQLGNTQAAVDAQINQAQALQTLGLYRRAIALLNDLNLQLQHQPPSLTQALALRSLGDALQASGSLEQAAQALQQSLQVSQAQPPSPQQQEAIAAATLSLGNVERAQAFSVLTLNNLTASEAIARLNRPPLSGLSGFQRLYEARQNRSAAEFYRRTEAVLNTYQQAGDRAILPATRLQAQLNQFSLLVETERWVRARSLYPALESHLQQLTPSRSSLYSQISLAASLLKLISGDPQVSSEADLQPLAVAQRLAAAARQAEAMGDGRSQSFALGNLGSLYEQQGQVEAAKTLTQQALRLSQGLRAEDISYRWQWQLGRLLVAQGQRPEAIAAYSQAIQSLQSLRSDLVAINRDVQFSFRESVEPVYRQLVNLLLQPEQQSTAELAQARDVIEGLQIAELDNFFQEACLDTQFQLDAVIDQQNLPTAAIFYTIVLGDRIETILKLPQQPLRHYSVAVPQAEVEATVTALLDQLKLPYFLPDAQRRAQKLYDWLIRPAQDALSENQTLVFVLDGALRSIPMAVLHDGSDYLIQHYSIALAPGLQLPDPKPLQPRQFRALIAGLTEARDGFPPLQFVAEEVQDIQAALPSQVLLNQSFTQQNFQAALQAAPYSIVHVATHGEFSSNAADTYILAWDQRVNVNQLSTLLQGQELDSPQPIELLVLSACRTAEGDRRAALGLAGVAVRAGARSTIASLWSVDDETGAALMSDFYRQLTQSAVSKAEALRQAQLHLLATHDEPKFWAPYVLLGNWL